jgi:ATP-dependent RNA helicase DeaD
LKRLADANPDIFSVVFVVPKEIHKLLLKISRRWIQRCCIARDLSQAQRDGVMKSLEEDKSMLVATDVAARGIDVDNITHVVNYQLLTK